MPLDDKGRCCGRKPLVYKRASGPRHPAGLFCCRCDRSYTADGEPQANWAWNADHTISTYAGKRSSEVAP
jgi:hypothetical protein